MRNEYIRTLVDEGATIETVGGKGASLVRLSRAGLPVPGGFCVTTRAYQRYVAANELADGIEQAVSAANPESPDTLEGASDAIRVLFAEGEMPGELAADIARAYAGLPGSDPAVAVRSSATAEDLPDLSFAGQQDTYLNVSGSGQVLAAVKRCWASLWTARAIGYRLRHGIDQEIVSLAVVVQTLVPAEVAGILFTANPMTGARSEMVASAAWGLGEAIVGGLVTPDTVTIDSDSGRVLSREIADKEIMTVREEGGTRELPVPEDLRRAPALSDSVAAELARLGAEIQSLYGQPMDIEWTLTDGELAIVQARPITALPDEISSAPVDWALPDPDGQYMRASIIDLMPAPLSPLFETLGLAELNLAIQRLTGSFLASEGVLRDEIYVTINHYVYMYTAFNRREIWGMLTKMAPRFPKLMREGTRWWQETMYPDYVQTVARWEARSLTEMTPSELLDGVHQMTAAILDHLGSLMVGTMGISAGSEMLFTRVYDKLVKREGDPAAPTFLMGYDTTPIRSEKSLYDLAAWCGEQPDMAEYVAETPAERLTADLALATAPEALDQGIWDEWRSRFQGHLEDYGYLIYDLDFAQELPMDDPEPMLVAIKMYRSGQGANPHERQAASASRREQAMLDAEARLRGIKRWAFRKTLGWAQRLAQVREDGIAAIGLGYPLTRRMLTELGGRLAQAGAIEDAGDAFWLEERELMQAIAALEADQAPESFADQVRERKAERQALLEVTPPPMLPPSEKYMGVKVDSYIAASEDGQTGPSIKGLGASPGRVTGVARVLRGPGEFGQMGPGEILVAGITTPAWTPLFAMAAAVVTDVGGPLSHGSIVAREYGIPAVLGTGVATRRIESGQTITVDGSAGLVILVS